MSAPPPGTCPNCREPGLVGSPCDEKPCRIRGYHRIPSALIERATRLEPEIGLMLAGRYLLVELLGEGGFGRVFVALQQPLEMRVALKILKPDRDVELHAQRMRGFRQEARAMSQIQHPNVVKILDFGVFDSAAFLVMELLEGGLTLKEAIKRHARTHTTLTLADVETILSGVLHGLAEAHAHGLVHRDIKPDNIILQDKPGHPLLPRILDFGLAKFVDAETQSSAILGTPMYMAPEQLTKVDPGPWTDLYALGVIAFELMTGRRPFSGEVAQVLADKRDPRFDVAQAVADLDVPAPILAFLRQALAFDTQARFRSTAAFGEAMQAAFRAAEGGADARTRAIDVSRLSTPSDRVDRIVPEPATLALIPAEPTEAVTPDPGLAETIDEPVPAEVRALSAPPPAPGTTDSAPSDTRPTTTDSVPVPAPARGIGGVDARRPGGAGLPAGIVVGALLLVAAVVGVIVATSGARTPEIETDTRVASPDTPLAVADTQLAAVVTSPDATLDGAPIAETVPNDEELCRRAAAAREDLAAWQRYLAHYPKGVCEPEATLMVALLEGRVPVDDPRVVRDAQGRVTQLMARDAATMLAQLAGSDFSGPAQQSAQLIWKVFRFEQSWTPTRITYVTPKATAADYPAGLGALATGGDLELQEGQVVVIGPGRYILPKGLRIYKKKRVAIVAMPGAELFVHSGNAVLAIDKCDEVAISGLYMNHHALDQDGVYRRESTCDYEVWSPNIKRSIVLDVVDSSAVRIHDVDLEGSGFIGLRAQRSRGITLRRAIIHDCIAEAIRLESSTLDARDVLAYRIGARTFTSSVKCFFPPCGSVPSPIVRFTTAITVDKSSELTLDQATLVVPSPLETSEAFVVDGTATVTKSLVVQDRGLVNSKHRGTLSVRDSCATGPAWSDAIDRASLQIVTGHISLPEPGLGVSFINTPTVPPSCAGFGALVGKDGVPRRELPR